MTVFVDTSALYALLDADDAGHHAVRAEWEKLLAGGELLVTSNYVLVEACALVQHRLGLSALRALDEEVAPILSVHWIDETLHRAAVAMLRVAAQRHLSLVDCTSFEVMRHGGIETAFTLDRHFAAQGFRLIPDAKGLSVNEP